MVSYCRSGVETSTMIGTSSEMAGIKGSISDGSSFFAVDQNAYYTYYGGQWYETMPEAARLYHSDVGTDVKPIKLVGGVATAVQYTLAKDSTVVHKTGEETVSGKKTFTADNIHSGNESFSGANTFSGSNTLSGANTLSGDNTFSGSNSFTKANTFSGNNTLSGANTFSGNNSFSGDNTFSGDDTFSGDETFSKPVAIGDTGIKIGTRTILGGAKVAYLTITVGDIAYEKVLGTFTNGEWS